MGWALGALECFQSLNYLSANYIGLIINFHRLNSMRMHGAFRQDVYFTSSNFARLFLLSSFVQRSRVRYIRFYLNLPHHHHYHVYRFDLATAARCQSNELDKADETHSLQAQFILRGQDRNLTMLFGLLGLPACLSVYCC